MTNTIQSIPLTKLFPHPANANRMSKANFAKLIAHIKRTGRYEPIVVRPLTKPVKTGGFYQILNGQHRVQALKQLGYAEADCVVWQVDDTEAKILLATLNRLTGRDDLHKKSDLIKQLSECFSLSQMAKLLPDAKKQLERLKSLPSATSVPAAVKTKAFANAVVFFLTDRQKCILGQALKLAERPAKTTAERRADALVKLAQSFIENVTDPGP